jgi:hypothetical protein
MWRPRLSAAYYQQLNCLSGFHEVWYRSSLQNVKWIWVVWRSAHWQPFVTWGSKFIPTLLSLFLQVKYGIEDLNIILPRDRPIWVAIFPFLDFVMAHPSNPNKCPQKPHLPQPHPRWHIGGRRRAVPWLLPASGSDFVKQAANAIDHSLPSVWKGLHAKGQYQVFAIGTSLPN